MRTFQFQKLVTFVGIVLFIVKLIAWRIANSGVIFSDTMESIVNIIAALIGLYFLYLYNRPRGIDHPYRHDKVEFVTASIEGMLIAIVGILTLIEAFSSPIKEIHLGKLDWGIALFGSTVIVNYTMGYISYQKGKKENSLILISAGKHLQSDIYATSAIVLGLLLMHFTGWRWLDPLIAIGFGNYIIVIGWKTVRRAFNGVMDERDEALFTNVVKIFQTCRHVKWIDMHNMRIQQFGAHLHIDAHITLPYYYPLQQAYQETERVIYLLAEKVDRFIEFGLHLDHYKDLSCELCSVNCPSRRKPFIKTIVWNRENVGGISKYRINN